MVFKVKNVPLRRSLGKKVNYRCCSNWWCKCILPMACSGQKKCFRRKLFQKILIELTLMTENFPNMKMLAWICLYKIVPIKICCSDVKGMNTKKRFICKKDPKHVYLKMFMMLIYKKAWSKSLSFSLIRLGSW